MNTMLKVFILGGLLTSSAPAIAQDDRPEPPPMEGEGTGGAEIDDLEAELAAELERIGAQQPREPAGTGLAGTAVTGTGGVRTARGLSNYFNPAISASGLILAGATTRSHHHETETDGEEDQEEHHDHSARGDLTTGLHLQEIELSLSAIVDPYFRADLTLAAHGEHIHFEEGYVTTLAIPRLNLRAGRFYADLGRHNALHTHAFPFLTAPLPWRELFGGHGLGDVGVSADLLVPLPFYTELNAQVFSGEWMILEGGLSEELFEVDRREPEDLAYVGHLETLFELDESSTVQLGGSYLGGRNGWGEWTHLLMGDLTFKWKPVSAERYTGLEWTSEVAWVNRGGDPECEEIGGAYSSLRFQFAQRWWIQARGALLGLPAGPHGRTWRGEGLLALVFSEYSALRLQYGYETMEEGDEDPVHEVFAQMNFSIGSHPTHAY